MTNLNFLQELAQTIEFTPEQIELEDDRTKYVVELNKACYEIMELRDLLFDIVVENCVDSNGRIGLPPTRLYEEAVEYFKEVGWISPSGEIWRDAICEN